MPQSYIVTTMVKNYSSHHINHDWLSNHHMILFYTIIPQGKCLISHEMHHCIHYLVYNTLIINTCSILFWNNFIPHINYRYMQTNIDFYFKMTKTSAKSRVSFLLKVLIKEDDKKSNFLKYVYVEIYLWWVVILYEVALYIINIFHFPYK